MLMLVQQIVIDPEGDFVTLADAFGHVVIDAGAYDNREIVQLAARVREHRASVVLALDNLELEAQMRCAAMFLSTMFDAPRDHWYPALVVVDEAQNLEPTTLKTILTRIGEGTKVIFTGDTSQIDAPYLGESNNALAVLIGAFRGQKCFGHITLTSCERSEVASLAAELL